MGARGRKQGQASTLTRATRMEPPMDAIAYALESQVDPNELLGFYQAQRHRAVPQSPEKLQEIYDQSAR